MECAQADELIALNALRALDGEQQRALEAHLAACAACRNRAAQLAARLARLQEEMRAPDFGTPALRALRVRVRRRLWVERLARRALPALARAAAALIIAAGLIFAWQTLRGHAGTWMRTGVAAVAGNDSAYPVITEKEVLVLVDDPDGQRLSTLDRRTGARLWQTAFPVAGLPCADAKRIYVWKVEKDSGLRLVALQRRTGKPAWTADAALPPQAPPAQITVAGPKLCWSDSGGITVLNAGSGRQVWTRALAPGGPLSAPATDGRRLFVASGDALYAFDLASGRPGWQTSLERVMSFAPRPRVQCAGGVVAVARSVLPRRGCLETFRAESGDALWRRDTTAPQHLLAAGAKFFVRGAGIQAFDALTGDLAWTAPVGGCSPIAADGGRIYVMEGIERRGAYALNADTGRPVWDKQPMSSCSGLVVLGQTGYLVTQDGELHAMAI